MVLSDTVAKVDNMDQSAAVEVVDNCIYNWLVVVEVIDTTVAFDSFEIPAVVYPLMDLILFEVPVLMILFCLIVVIGRNFCSSN